MSKSPRRRSRHSKWLTGCSPDESISDVARKALRGRADELLFYLDQASRKKRFQTQQATKAVHQLRVASRRMVTAIEVFSDCIPAKRSRQVALESKRIRRAAGKARDCDVLIERYERTHGEGTDDDVLAELNKHRRQAQEPLVRLRKRLQGLDYAKQLDALIARVAWRGGGREPTFATVARNELAPLVAQFFSFSINESTELQELHEMRICGKRLRYAIELLAAGFPPSLRRRVYPKFVKIQQSLGDLHDHVAAARRLKEWCQETDGKSAARSLNRLRRAEKQEAAAKSRDFHEWWQGEAKRLEKRFRKLL